MQDFTEYFNEVFFSTSTRRLEYHMVSVEHQSEVDFEQETNAIRDQKIESTEASRAFEGKKALEEFRRYAQYIDCEDTSRMAKMKGNFGLDLIKSNLLSLESNNFD